MAEHRNSNERTRFRAVIRLDLMLHVTRQLSGASVASSMASMSIIAAWFRSRNHHRRAVSASQAHDEARAAAGKLRARNSRRDFSDRQTRLLSLPQYPTRKLGARRFWTSSSDIIFERINV